MFIGSWAQAFRKFHPDAFSLWLENHLWWRWGKMEDKVKYTESQFLGTLTQRSSACPQLLGIHTFPVNNLRKNERQPISGRASPSPPRRTGVLFLPHDSYQTSARATTFGHQSRIKARWNGTLRFPTWSHASDKSSWGNFEHTESWAAGLNDSESS